MNLIYKADFLNLGISYGKKAFGSRYINLRVYLITNALSDVNNSNYSG
jgi:hypothetical protein